MLTLRPMPGAVAFPIVPSGLTVGRSGSSRPPIPRVQSRTTFSFHFEKPENESSAKETRPNMSTKTLPLPDSSEPRLQAARMKAFEVQPAVPGTECPSEHFNRKGLRLLRATRRRSAMAQVAGNSAGRQKISITPVGILSPRSRL